MYEITRYSWLKGSGIITYSLFWFQPL